MRPGLVTVVVGSGVQSTEPSREVAAYLTAQIAGAIGEAILADAMFTEPVVHLSPRPIRGAPVSGRSDRDQASSGPLDMPPVGISSIR